MKINHRILGESNRHITSFEKNLIGKLNMVSNIDHVEVLYDETLLDVDDSYYLLLSVQLSGGKRITTTTSDNLQYGALKKAVDLTRLKITEMSASNKNSTIISMNTPNNMQEAI